MSTLVIIKIIFISAVILLAIYAATYNLRYKLWKQKLDKLINEIKSGAELRPLNDLELCDLNKYVSKEPNDLNTLLSIYSAKTLVVDEKIYKKICRRIPEYEDKIKFYDMIFNQSEKDSHAHSILSQLEKYIKGTNQ